MKKLYIVFIIIFSSTLISAASFTMSDLRLQERKSALNDFKKIHLRRLNFKHKLYKKAKHKRLKNVSHRFTPSSGENRHIEEGIVNDIGESMDSEVNHNANIQVTANENMDIVIQSGGNIKEYKEYKEYKDKKEIDSIAKPTIENILAENKPETTKPTKGEKTETYKESIPVSGSDDTAPTTSDTVPTTSDTAPTTSDTAPTTSDTAPTTSDTIRTRYISPWARKR